jgi:hypothetical protein
MRCTVVLAPLVVLALAGCGGGSTHAASPAGQPAGGMRYSKPTALISCLTRKHIDAERKTAGMEAYSAARSAGATLISIGSENGELNYGDLWLFGSADGARSGKTAAEAQNQADPLSGYAQIVVVGRVVGGLTRAGSQALGSIDACAPA